MAESNLNRLLVRGSIFFPERISDIEAWQRHIPFAFALIGMLKPGMLVELGTHYGDSYCAFCQAVKEHSLDTQCFAVDTWEGDSQAGYYGTEVFADLKKHHDPRYGGFSSLMRMSFDQATEHFPDNSIDLLHIDGLHTYDAVKHDFDNWLPKMSDQGVILFHDTAVTEADFGVGKLWRELTANYPGFEFGFGFGLGVLLVGKRYPEELEAFMQLCTAEPDLIEQLFHRLGDTIELKKESKKLQVIKESREALGQDLDYSRSIVEERDRQLQHKSLLIDELGADLAHARAVVQERDASLADLNCERKISEQRKEQLTKLTILLANNRDELLCMSRSRWHRIRDGLHRMLGQGSSVPIPALERVPDVDTHYLALGLPVDIIIPVYRGLEETKACIQSVLDSDIGVPIEVVVINDATTEVPLRSWLESISDQVTLLHNEFNRGFVATVNRGMSLHPDRDVLLLNSDTVVANDWLDRLQDCAYRENYTSSVTPLSNNATICSYPNFCENNLLPQGYDLQHMDALVREINMGRSVVIPTAIGFCMYIRRDSLNQVGLFDEGLFGRGYGEENEFCMRSAAIGWQHLLCEDTFVYHAGGVSFGDTKNEHQQAGHRVLTRLYPDYDQRIQKFIDRDPGSSRRFVLDLARFCKPGMPAVLMINHSRGGGTDRHLKELAAAIEATTTVLVLKPHGQEGQAVKLHLAEGNEQNCLLVDPLADYELLVDILRDAGVCRVHFHHTIGVHPQFWKLAEDLSVPFDFTIHDYYLACPQITMTKTDGGYCGEPDDKGCNECLRRRPAPGNVSIEDWRNECSKLMYSADRVFVPSHDVEQKIKRYFPKANTLYAPHEKEIYDEVSIRPRKLNPDETLRVVVLGALSHFKGADLLEICAINARIDRLPIEFHLIGFGYRRLTCYPGSNLTVHGRYEEKDLEKLVKEADPHLIWFPGSCPETYSYTLSTCFKLGLPVMAHAVGAFTERLAGREWSWLLAHSLAPERVLEKLLEVREQFLRTQPPEKVSGTSCSTYFAYSDHYFSGKENREKDEAASKIDWMAFNLRLEKLSTRAPIENLQAKGVGFIIFSTLQRVQTMPILARLSAAMSPRLKSSIKSRLTRVDRA